MSDLLVVRPENDVDHVLWEGDPTYFKTGKDISLFDLAYPQATQHDRTAIIASNGRVTSVLFELTRSDTTGSHVEYIPFQWRPVEAPSTIRGSSSVHAGSYEATIALTDYISSDTPQYDGHLSQMVPPGVALTISANLNVTLNLRTGVLKTEADAQVSPACEGLTVKLVAFTADLFYTD